MYNKCNMFIRQAAIFPVRVYQHTFSLLKPPACRFYPSCSSYAIEAVLRHGVIKGGFLAIWRILRCQPWSAGGYDPVPPVKNL